MGDTKQSWKDIFLVIIIVVYMFYSDSKRKTFFCI